MEEMKALKKKKIWDLLDKPKGKMFSRCKLVFVVKYKSDRSTEKYKVRLVAKGFTQTNHIDYQETFAPITKLNTERVLLSLAANLDWWLQQLDIKNAFLNGDLEEEVYMELPPWFDQRNEGKVYKLRKSPYGLKQSPRALSERFTKAIMMHGYTQAQSNHTVFYRHSDGQVTILIVYMDDIIMIGNDPMELKRLKGKLVAKFETKDLWPLHYFLGMEMARNKNGISVSQRKYILDLLKETGMLEYKPVDTPMDPIKKIGEQKESTPVDTRRYQRLVGKLIYLSHTRPDITFAVSIMS